MVLLLYMLYDKLRYANAIYKLWQRSNVYPNKKRPEFASKMGYAKYSKHYYKIIDRMKKEHIINDDGRWISTLTNECLRNLPSMTSPDTAKILGYESAYKIYLAIFFGDTSPVELSKDLDIKRPTVHAVIKKLLGYSLITKDRYILSINKDTGMYRWLSLYIAACYAEARVTATSVVLFDCVPGYIDGMQAYHITHYQSGMPMGCANMIIRSSKLYHRFWRTLIDDIKYYEDYPKKVTVMSPEKNAYIVIHSGVPVNKNSKKWR